MIFPKVSARPRICKRKSSGVEVRRGESIAKTQKVKFNTDKGTRAYEKKIVRENISIILETGSRTKKQIRSSHPKP